MAEHKFKTTSIKGKDYVEVNERIKYFRTSDDYHGWTLTSEIHSLNDESCVMKATIRNSEGVEVATGYAQEDKSSSYINKTSFVENCETSAWGRALGNLGIGIDTSIATADEVDMAIKKQEVVKEKEKPQPKEVKKPTPKAEKADEVLETHHQKFLNLLASKPTMGVLKGAVGKALTEYKISSETLKEWMIESGVKDDAIEKLLS